MKFCYRCGTPYKGDFCPEDFTTLYTTEFNSQTVKLMRDITGYGIMDCRQALILFDGDIRQAHKYLNIRGLAVVRKKPDGTKWEEQDYINHIKGIST